jgi:hypothetical protein
MVGWRSRLILVATVGSTGCLSFLQGEPEAERVPAAASCTRVMERVEDDGDLRVRRTTLFDARGREVSGSDVDDDGDLVASWAYERDELGYLVDSSWDEDGDGALDYHWTGLRDGDRLLQYEADEDGDGIVDLIAENTWDRDEVVRQVRSRPSGSPYADEVDTITYERGRNVLQVTVRDGVPWQQYASTYAREDGLLVDRYVGTDLVSGEEFASIEDRYDGLDRVVLHIEFDPETGAPSFESDTTYDGRRPSYVYREDDDADGAIDFREDATFDARDLEVSTEYRSTDDGEPYLVDTYTWSCP